MEALIDEMLAGKILLAEAVGEFEKIYIEKALVQNGRHLIKTSAALGIHRNTLSAKLYVYKESRNAGEAKRGSGQSLIRKKQPSRKLKERAAGGSR
jgi:DNA-binding NtrC family response regulator